MSFKNFLSLLIAIVLSPIVFTQFDLNTNNGQTVTAAGCTGTLTDTPSGNYSSGSTQTITIQSPNTGEGVCLDFTQWDLDFSIFDSYPNGMTNLRFYDGNSTSSPLIEGATGDWDVNQSSSIGNEYDFTGPGMVCSSGGPLTIEFVRNGSGTGFSANITCLIPPSTNTCSINISADQTTICDGETVNLTVTGELTSPLLDNNFNDGTIGTGWSSSINGRFDNPCEAGLDGSTHFWIGTNPSPRDFTSIPFDVSLGGSVYFEIDFSDQGNGAPCEGPDLTTEGVYFQYSVDGGTNWITLHYFFPEEYTEGSNNIHSWQGYYFAIPAAAQTASTQFRWTQRRASSNTTDHWGLDNIKIVSPKQTTIRIKENSPTGTVIASSLTSPLNYSVTPSTTTTYYATISDGVDSCTQQVTVTVNPSTVPTFTPPSNLCENGPSYNLPTSSEDTPAITGSWDSAAATTTSSGTTTYTFIPDPGQCANTTTMNITVDPSITPIFTAVPDICSGDILSPLPTTSNNSITGSWGPALNNTSTTTYTFTPDAPQCASNQNLTITVNPNEDATFTLTPTCDGVTASITGTTGGTFSFTTPPGDAAVIDASTGTVTGGTSGNTYDITYTTSGACAANTNQSATATSSDDATFSLTPTCDGATASISGTTGGTFTFTTPPGDAAVIDASTGTVTGGTSGSTYDITYTTSGTCAASTNQTATATNSDDATFTLTPTCDGASASISGTAGGTFSFTTPPVDAAVIDASTGTVTGGTSGNTYDITYSTSGACAASSNLTATATNSDDATFTLTPTCDGATASISGTTGGTFTFTTPPSDAAVIDASTGTVTGGTSGNTYDVTYATSGACAASSNLTTTATNADDATFTLTPTCDGATASISGTTGGTFSFTTPPVDAAVIDANTGTVTGGNSGNTYDITYATSGACAASTNLTATATNADDATFTLTPTCDGASASISGTTGGAFSFTTPPSDAAVIDANTGTVTGGTSGNTYDITYTTTGACSASSNLTTTATNSDDATFTLTPTCDGATATISGTTGGTFSFTTPPSDAAVIDANTGTVTGGTSGNTYDITYATSGACAASSNLTTTATNADDATFTLTPTCDGSTASISGTTGGTFSFTTPPSDAAVIDANSGTITGGSSGSTYDITYSTTGTCAANTNQTVSSLITPTITSQPQDTPVCAASPTSFSVVASNGINYQWEMRTNSTGTFAPLSDAGVYSNTQTSTLNISNCTGLNGLEFRVIVSDASGNCSITSNNAVLTVNVIETPAISCGTSTLSSVEFNWSALTGATSYSIAYSVNSGASQNGGTVTSSSYTLSSLNPGDVVDITINTTGSTSCYAQSSFTCASQTCTSPTIINQPTLSPSCSGEPEVLSVTASSEATGYRWEISTDGGNSFTPLFNAALYSGVNTSSLSITDNSLLDTYQYRVVISEANNTCPTTSNPVTFVVNPSPTISGTLVACPTLTSQLSATTSPSLSTPWISASTNVATIDNTGLVTAESGGTSLITYTDINGCTETVTMTVPADDTPIISCGTSTTSSVTFDWNVPASVSSFDITYSINGQTPINAGNQNLGSYSLNNLTVDDTVSITINTNGTGCYQQATGVCYSESCTPSQALFLPEPKTITSSNPITTFINSSVNSNTYLWDFGDGNTSSQANPNHEYTINNETENYEVTLIAYNVDGCNDTTRQTVLVKEELIYYVPNTFTPDGDEFNNEFKPIFYSGHDPYSYTMVIFNRWGEIVYETSNLDIGWKGTYGDSGDIVQDGVYIWKINFNEKGIDKNIEITGHVLLIK